MYSIVQLLCILFNSAITMDFVYGFEKDDFLSTYMYMYTYMPSKYMYTYVHIHIKYIIDISVVVLHIRYVLYMCTYVRR